MQLYKPRGFGEYFQDTFAFLKRHGKHFYKHFFIINGIFLLILMVMGYFFSKFYTDIIFGGILNNGGNPFEEYINQNAGLFFLMVILFLTIGLIAGIISYSYVPIYLKLYNKNNGTGFTATDIINTYKANIGKIFIFLICGILIAFPMIIFLGLLMFVLTITLIGILLLPLVIGGASLYYQGALIEYLNHKRGIWESFGYTWKLMSSKFWPAIGCVGLFYLMSYVVQQIVSLVPYVFGMINLFTNIDDGVAPDPQEITNSFTIMMIAVFFLTFIVSTFLNVIVQLNQGVVIYSLKEENENINTKSDIDLIGSGE